MNPATLDTIASQAIPDNMNGITTGMALNLMPTGPTESLILKPSETPMAKKAETNPSTTPDTPTTQVSRISQPDACRAALKAGYDKPADAVKWIKDTHGLDVSPQVFSGVKLREKEARERTKGSGRKSVSPREKSEVAAKPPVTPKAAAEAVVAASTPASSPISSPAPSTTELLTDMAVIKDLVAKHGAEAVKWIADIVE